MNIPELKQRLIAVVESSESPKNVFSNIADAVADVSDAPGTFLNRIHTPGYNPDKESLEYCCRELVNYCLLLDENLLVKMEEEVLRREKNE